MNPYVEVTPSVNEIANGKRKFIEGWIRPFWCMDKLSISWEGQTRNLTQVVSILAGIQDFPAWEYPITFYDDVDLIYAEIRRRDSGVVPPDNHQGLRTNALGLSGQSPNPPHLDRIPCEADHFGAIFLQNLLEDPARMPFKPEVEDPNIVFGMDSCRQVLKLKGLKHKKPRKTPHCHHVAVGLY
jgi:hypothetical protein